MIGPSGGGKTTLLRVLAGLLTPDEGIVELNGERIEYDDESLLRHRRSVGVVFQSFNLFPHMTALANITLALEKVHNHPPGAARDLAHSLLERFQLLDHAEKRPAALSGGQRQRIAICRAVAARPKVLFFDEPTSALDPEMTSEVLDMIRQLLEEGSKLVLVTHEMNFAKVVGDRVAFLAEGAVVELGSPSQVFENPQTEACRKFLQTVQKY